MIWWVLGGAAGLVLALAAIGYISSVDVDF